MEFGDAMSHMSQCALGFVEVSGVSCRVCSHSMSQNMLAAFDRMRMVIEKINGDVLVRAQRIFCFAWDLLLQSSRFGG